MRQRVSILFLIEHLFLMSMIRMKIDEWSMKIEQTALERFQDCSRLICSNGDTVIDNICIWDCALFSNPISCRHEHLHFIMFSFPIDFSLNLNTARIKLGINVLKGSTWSHKNFIKNWYLRNTRKCRNNTLLTKCSKFTTVLHRRAVSVKVGVCNVDWL